MTSEVVSLAEDATAADAVAAIRGLDENFESVHYVYLKDEKGRLSGVVSLRHLITSDSETKLSDIAYGDLVFAHPDDDQEDVSRDIAKYNLLAMPVVDENKRLLGIVTVDDALDVLEEEHEEDLQIAGARRSDPEGRTGSHDILWLLRNELWFFVWMLGLALLALLMGREGRGIVLTLGAAMPAAVVAALDSVGFVTNFFIENDPNDEDTPSLAGFAFKGIGLGLLFAAFVALVSMGVFSVLFAGDASTAHIVRMGTASFAAAAASIVVSFVLCPVYLIVLRSRDEKNLDTSGIALQVTSMLLSLVVFCAIALALAGSWGN